MPSAGGNDDGNVLRTISSACLRTHICSLAAAVEDAYTNTEKQWTYQLQTDSALPDAESNIIDTDARCHTYSVLIQAHHIEHYGVPTLYVIDRNARTLTTSRVSVMETYLTGGRCTRETIAWCRSALTELVGQFNAEHKRKAGTVISTVLPGADRLSAPARDALRAYMPDKLPSGSVVELTGDTVRVVYKEHTGTQADLDALGCVSDDLLARAVARWKVRRVVQSAVADGPPGDYGLDAFVRELRDITRQMKTGGPVP